MTEDFDPARCTFDGYGSSDAARDWYSRKELPMKHYWLGRDIETLSRDELLEVVKELAAHLQSTRETCASIVRTSAMLAKLKC